MAHLGERLRKQRLSCGVDLSYIATQTRISARYLEALENGDWNQLPGVLFARSFARQYAELVGLTGPSIEAEIQAAFQDEQPAPVVEAFGAPPPRFQFSIAPLKDLIESGLESRLPLYAVALAGVIGLCSAVYVGWQRFVLPTENNTAEIRMQIPPTQAPVERVPVSSPPPSAEPASTAVAAPAAPSDSRELQVSTKDLGNGTAEMEMVVSESNAQGMAVRIVASQETWVSITANGKKLYSGILQPNDVRSLKGVERAQVVIGNAGGVEVSKNGHSIGPIGNPGEVRVVELTPQGPPLIKKNPPPVDPDSTETTARTD